MTVVGANWEKVRHAVGPQPPREEVLVMPWHADPHLAGLGLLLHGSVGARDLYTHICNTNSNRDLLSSNTISGEFSSSQSW